MKSVKNSALIILMFLTPFFLKGADPETKTWKVFEFRTTSNKQLKLITSK